jgi:hypothetical protein
MPIPVRSSSYLPWLATTGPLASFTKHQQSQSLTVIFPHFKDPLRLVLLPVLSTSTMLTPFSPELSWPKLAPTLLEQLLMFLR